MGSPSNSHNSDSLLHFASSFVSWAWTIMGLAHSPFSCPFPWTPLYWEFNFVFPTTLDHILKLSLTPTLSLETLTCELSSVISLWLLLTLLINLLHDDCGLTIHHSFLLPSLYFLLPKIHLIFYFLSFFSFFSHFSSTYQTYLYMVCL